MNRQKEVTCMTTTKRNGKRLTAAALVAALGATLAAASLGWAAASARPTNLDPPTISGKAEVGQTLSATTGRWSNNPVDFAYEWRRCDANGGSCSTISGANTKDYALKTVDRENTLRVRVTAQNPDGTATATSVPTGVVAAAATPPTTPAPGGGCGSGSSVSASNLAPPERLSIDRQEVQPGTIGRSVSNVTVRFRVSACNGKPVEGAMVYVTAVPYNQFSVPNEVQTGADGFAQLQLNRLRGYPATPNQRLLVMFVRARKSGENVLGGVSTRRLVSFRVNLAAG
jgi:hypothetical protein